jgi:large conductance mechanosensitive channel
MLKEFKEFAIKGNVMDLAIGVIIGGAFNRIVNSLVNDVVMPLFSSITGKVDFTNFFISLDGKHYVDLAAAKAANAPTLNYGMFIAAIIDFLIIAFSIFLVIRQLNRFRAKPAPAPTSRECPFCLTSIPIKALRCPHCTSHLDAE